jgi:hypothetical protein
MLSELRKDLENAADMVNQIELIRSQLGALTPMIDGSTATADATAIKRSADELDKQLIEVEDNLIQRRLTVRARTLRVGRQS